MKPAFHQQSEMNSEGRINTVNEVYREIKLQMKKFISNNIIVIVFTLAGITGGFFYWKYVGCNSGSCPIKSVWYWSSLWGGVFGYLSGDLLNDLIRKYWNRK